MYLGYQNGLIKFYTTKRLDPVFYNLDKVERTQDEYVLDGDRYVLKDEAWEQEQAAKEAARIQTLSMTRSDFFDGTIKAFGADSDDLLTAIQAVLVNIQITDLEKKVAINNYKNALNFYRKHPLFTLLSDVPIPVGNNVTITITSQQWDRFFDETDKKNPNAYRELLPTVPQDETEEE